jgi:NAD(P)-dependent dehydrogenase (short-subunit alcohol dehydrogenase family)
VDLGLRGKRALVPGSTAGIGFATARALAIEGAHVTVNGRTEARVGNAVDRLSRELSDATVAGFAADLSSGDGCRVLIGHLPDVDVLVNNLGIFEPKPFEEIPDED